MQVPLEQSVEQRPVLRVVSMVPRPLAQAGLPADGYVTETARGILQWTYHLLGMQQQTWVL